MRAPTLKCVTCEVLWAVEQGWTCWVCRQLGEPTVHRYSQDAEERRR